MTRHQSYHIKSYPLYSNKHFQRNITKKISYCCHEKTWEVCGSFILLFLLTLALHSTLRPGTSQWDFHLFCSTGDPTYLQWMTRDEKCQSCCSMVKTEQVASLFSSLLQKKKFWNVWDLTICILSKERRNIWRAFLRRFDRWTLKRFFLLLLLLPLESSICSKWEYLILGNVQRDVWPPLYQEFKIDQFKKKKKKVLKKKF